MSKERVGSQNDRLGFTFLALDPVRGDARSRGAPTLRHAGYRRLQETGQATKPQDHQS